MTAQSLPLGGQVALVTGASRGIGRAIAVEFARAGADIVIVSRSTEAAPPKIPGTIEETARQVQALGRQALAIPADVSNDEHVQAMARRTMQSMCPSWCRSSTSLSSVTKMKRSTLSGRTTGSNASRSRATLPSLIMM